jgi:DNA (cytosine-5)-methyltransferase 1
MPNLVSIYAGCGGLDLGFHKAGFEIIYSTDYWNVACETLKYNGHSKEVVCDDITKINFKAILEKNQIKNIDCLIGGPPCPPYSQTRHYLTEKKNGMDDERYGFTLSEYCRAVKELNPTVFLFENVDGFLHKLHTREFDFLLAFAEENGYQISYKVINAANYGIPQTRKRFIAIGVKKEYSEFVFPEELYANPDDISSKKIDKKPWITAGEVLKDLDIDLPEDETKQAGSKHKDLLKLIPPGDNYLFFTAKRGYPSPVFEWKSRYWTFLLKLSQDRPSWTIQASFSNNQGPFHWKNRFLRINEIKRLQTIDDNYEILGSFQQWRQIGNAVPTKLAEILAIAIKNQIYNNLKIN